MWVFRWCCVVIALSMGGCAGLVKLEYYSIDGNQQLKYKRSCDEYRGGTAGVVVALSGPAEAAIFSNEELEIAFCTDQNERIVYSAGPVLPVIPLFLSTNESKEIAIYLYISKSLNNKGSDPF